MKMWIQLSLFLALASCLPDAQADEFGSGANSFSIDFVTIGSPGNPADTTGNPNPAGAVPYVYRIGKYEISEQMIDKANARGSLGITKDMRGPDFPATSITWFEAAQFVNWLNTSTGSAAAYKFDAGGNFQLWTPADAGYDASNLYRNKLATYFLPSLNEWHKAAYYDASAGVYYDYPTGSNAVPDGIDFVGDTVFDAVFDDGAFNAAPNEITNVGVLSPFGTVGQGGNVTEWLETAFDRGNDVPAEDRRENGGTWNGIDTGLFAPNGRTGLPPTFQSVALGLRISSQVPEPHSLSIAAILFGLSINFTCCRAKNCNPVNLD
jgi:formylglycine-generating enzyme required for sulfatase activity